VLVDPYECMTVGHIHREDDVIQVECNAGELAGVEPGRQLFLILTSMKTESARTSDAYTAQSPLHARIPLVLLQVIQPNDHVPSLGPITRIKHAIKYGPLTQCLLNMFAAQHLERLLRVQPQLCKLAHYLTFGTQLVENRERGELMFRVVNPVQPEHVRPCGDFACVQLNLGDERF